MNQASGPHTHHQTLVLVHCPAFPVMPRKLSPEPQKTPASILVHPQVIPHRRSSPHHERDKSSLDKRRVLVWHLRSGPTAACHIFPTSTTLRNPPAPQGEMFLLRDKPDCNLHTVLHRHRGTTGLVKTVQPPKTHVAATRPSCLI